MATEGKRARWTTIASFWKPKSTTATSLATGVCSTACPIMLSPGARLNFRKVDNPPRGGPEYELVAVDEYDVPAGRTDQDPTF